MIELKPCPFCGSKAQLDYIDDGNNGWWYSVVCMKPMCRCGVSNTDYSYCDAEDATEAWNRRAGEEVKDITIKEIKGFSSAYPSICNLKLLPSIDRTWITIQDDVGTSMTIKLSDLSDFIKADVLDKIRAEIIEEKDFAYTDFERYKVECLGVDAEYVEDELPQDDFRYGMERAIEIIDKYKIESEDKE